MKKVAILSVIFALPIAVVLFLQAFGDNRFDVPVYYQEEPPEFCGCEDIVIPYAVPMEYRPADSLLIVLFHEGLIREELSLQIVRILDKIQDKPIAFHKWGRNSRGMEGLTGHTVTQDEFNQNKMCVFHVPDGNNTVVVDGVGKIRGYYLIEDREEVDRLAAEVDILLKNNEYKAH